MSKKQIFVYIAVFLDVLSIGIFIPAMPLLAQRYHVSAGAVAMGTMVYGFASLLATPLLGQVSDKFGRKRPLILCVLGTALSYFSLLWGPYYIVFLVSRIINGITWGNFSILQAIISDLSPTAEQKTKSFWMMGALFGLGFIIGPLIWGLLVNSGLNRMFVFGGVLSLLDVFGLLFFLKETHPGDHEVKLHWFSLNTVYSVMRKPKYTYILLPFLLLTIAVNIYQSVLSLYMNSSFGWDGKQIGLLFAGVGIISALNMVVLIPKIRNKYFTKFQLIVGVHLSGIILLPLLGIGLPQAAFIVAIAFLFLTLNTVNPVYQSQVMTDVPGNRRGKMSGVMTALMNTGMVIGPLVWGLLLDIHVAPFWASFCMIVISIIIVMRKKEAHGKIVS